MRKSWKLLFSTLIALLVAVVVAGCGVNSESSGSEGEVGPTPSRIISLSPSATESLWAVGAGDQVVAVDDQSNYPAGVPTTELSGFTPNVEAILGHSPDLVIAMDAPDDLASSLQAAGVELLQLSAPATLDDAYAQIEQIGGATGHIAEAVELVKNMQTEIAAAVASVPAAETPLTYFHELDDTLYTVTSASFLGQVYGLFGLDNIADAVGAGNPYPQLQSEYVVSANPSVIFLADAQCCSVTAETVGARAGWAEVAAVKDGRIYALDADIASRWGPRIVDMVESLAQIMQSSPAPQPVR
ncbi:ABC transporter substrate-binding protein [Tomitella biformata]|uniref:ABC transporter substrate-binding protein n=1 Tax=Tomitella biformata TaxID=630403 RepID=UPI0004633C7F|nr:ABC transporter substrate-binding protein [Tomitella biformata]